MFVLRNSTLIGSLLLGVATVISLTGCQGNTPEAKASTTENGVAAMVNGEPITLPDFHEHTDLKKTAQVVTPRGAVQTQVIGNFGLQSLQELVDQKVLMQLAKGKGVLPTESDVDAELKLQTELRPDYVTSLTDQGWTNQRIQHEISVALARQFLILKGVEVSPTEIDTYIAKNPDKFSDPAQATLFFIQVGSADKKAKVDKELTHRPFTQVAGELSEDPNAKATGGLYATKIVASMPARVQKIVEKLQPKQTSDWNQDRGIFVKFYLEQKTVAKPRPIKAAQREMVRRLIGMQKGEQKNNFTKMFYDKLKASQVEVGVPYLKDQWKKTWDQLSSPTSDK